jgi:hypothetical protein
MVFPEPATKLKGYQEFPLGEDRKQRTFSMYPQERAGGFPLIEDISLKKPLSRTSVVNFACSVMVNGWIWGRKPS